MEKKVSRYWSEWDAKVILTPEKEPKRGKQIKDWAENSIYRMNAQGADCYCFSFNGSSWVGGWDWSEHIVDKTAEHCLMLATGQFYKISTK